MYIIKAQQCLYLDDRKFDLRFQRKPLSPKIEPAFGVDGMSCFNAIDCTFDSILCLSHHTAEEEICLTAWPLPESKLLRIVTLPYYPLN